MDIDSHPVMPVPGMVHAWYMHDIGTICMPCPVKADIVAGAVANPTAAELSWEDEPELPLTHFSNLSCSSTSKSPLTSSWTPSEGGDGSWSHGLQDPALVEVCGDIVC